MYLAWEEFRYLAFAKLSAILKRIKKLNKGKYYQ